MITNLCIAIILGLILLVLFFWLLEFIEFRRERRAHDQKTEEASANDSEMAKSAVACQQELINLRKFDVQARMKALRPPDDNEDTPPPHTAR